MFRYSVRTFQRALNFEDRSRPHVRPVSVHRSSREMDGSHAVACRETGGQADRQAGRQTGNFITLIDIFRNCVRTSLKNSESLNHSNKLVFSNQLLD